MKKCQLKVVLTVKPNGRLGKVRVLEPRDGSRVLLDRPWGLKDLNGFKVINKATGLLSKGLSDMTEVRQKANEARPRRRSLRKLPANKTPA